MPLKSSLPCFEKATFVTQKPNGKLQQVRIWSEVIASLQILADDNRRVQALPKPSRKLATSGVIGKFELCLPALRELNIIGSLERRMLTYLSLSKLGATLCYLLLPSSPPVAETIKTYRRQKMSASDSPCSEATVGRQTTEQFVLQRQ